MSKAPDLVRVSVLAEERGLSTPAMLRRLRRIERSMKRKVIFGGGQGCPWEADRAFLTEMAGNGGKSVWDRLRGLERTVTDLRTEVGEVRRLLAENGIV